MKYVGFFAFAAIGIPLMTALAVSSLRWRGRLLALLVFSTVLGDLASINFLSMEFYRGPDRGFEVTLTDLIAIALAMAILLRGGRVRWLPPGSLPMAAFFTLAIASAVVAEADVIAAFSIWKMCRVFLLYWVVVNLLHSGVRAEAVRSGLIAAGLFVAVLAFKQKYLDGIYRISGPFDHSNSVTLYLNLFLPVLMAWLIGDRTLRMRTLALCLLAVMGMVFAVLGTFSRTGAVLTIVACAAVLLPGILSVRNVRNGVAAGIVLIAGLGGLGMAADSFVERFLNAPESSAEARDEFNRAATAMAEDHMLGVGINTFPRVLTDDGRYRQFLRVVENEEQAGVAHHIYLLTAAETGFVGLALFLAIMARIFLVALRGIRSQSRLGALLLWGALVGFCTLHVGGLFEWAFRITPVLYMWAVASALAVGLAESARVPFRTT